MVRFDLVIRNGLIVDGSGTAAFIGDVALHDGRIAAVGRFDGVGYDELDASGNLVTPGFVDIHTHYDGQVTWERTLSPSSNHGVTTVVGGNCGVGFAPCRPDDREKLITVMEGVEDIPEIVMSTGLPWTWQTFPEYLDVLDKHTYDIDIAMQVAHSPLRVYVMGDRAVENEPSTELDRSRMTALVVDALRAGAVGVSTSRSLNHCAKSGRLAPSVGAAREEVLALAQGLAEAGSGVFQLIPEFSESPESEMKLIQQIARVSGKPVSFTLLENVGRTEDWRTYLAGVEDASAQGLQIRAQVFPRPVGILMGLDLSLNPIMDRPSYKAIEKLSLEERVRILKDAEFKMKLLAEEPVPDPQPLVNRIIAAVGRTSLLGDPPEYAPPCDMRLEAMASRLGVSPLSLAYDLMLKDNGRAILYLPGANYATGTLDAVREMMDHPMTVLGLGDGGAHYGMICDAGFPTFVLSYWTRDVDPRHRFSLEWAVAALSRRPAECVGLLDRGELKVGLKADLNIIDFDELRLGGLRVRRDLPSDGRRLWQVASGYHATIVAGVVTYRNGRPTGAMPGRLVRGQRVRSPTAA